MQTGLRASELVGLRCEDVVLGTGAHVRCLGKGRKERCTPLRKDAAAALRQWLSERNGQTSEVVFPNARGSTLSRDGLEYLLAKHLTTARVTCPSLKSKHVSPHVLRHSAARELLQHGWIVRSSRYGWVMNPSKRPRVIPTLILAQREKRWPRRIPSKGGQVVTGPAKNFWLSCRASENAES